ncbi:hypothetical protein PUT90_27910, partial [Klebsiella pneumoniae]|nr:hypothetical protein [Klebsiella pneumoniae]
SNDASSFNQSNGNAANGNGNFSTGTSGAAPLPSSMSGAGGGASASGNGGLSNAGLLGNDKNKSDDADQGGGMIQADAPTNS